MPLEPEIECKIIVRCQKKKKKRTEGKYEERLVTWHRWKGAGSVKQLDPLHRGGGGGGGGRRRLRERVIERALSEWSVSLGFKFLWLILSGFEICFVRVGILLL